ncbi:MAG: hypothetical protein ACT4NL_04110 [Pseudomarimonas sp.]
MDIRGSGWNSVSAGQSRTHGSQLGHAAWLLRCLLLLGCPWVHATTHSLADDWSDAVNPNGAWAYRHGGAILGPVSDWTLLPSPVAQPAWAAGLTVPAWLRSRSDNPTGLDFLTGDVVVHSASSGTSHANVSWTSPLNGAIGVVGGVWMARDTGRSNRWTLLLNDISISSGEIASGDPFSRTQPFNFAAGSGGPAAINALQVEVGDVLELRIERTSNFGDFVGVVLELIENQVFSDGFE